MSYLTVFFSEMEHILYLSPHLGCLRHPGVKLPVYNILYNRYSTCTLYIGESSSPVFTYILYSITPGSHFSYLGVTAH